MRKVRELCASTLPGEKNPEPCLLSVGIVFAFSHLHGAMKYHQVECSKTPEASWQLPYFIQGPREVDMENSMRKNRLIFSTS